MTKIIPMPPFDGVALGSVITCRPDINSRLLHGILLKATGHATNVISDIFEYFTVNQDDKQKILIKPLVQNMSDALDNANADTLDVAFAYIPFTRPGMNFSPWGTGDITRLSIQAKVKAAMIGAQSLTRLDGWLCYTPVAMPQPRGDVFLQSVITTPTPVAGWNTLANIEVRDISTLTKLIFGSTDVVEVKVSIGEQTVFQMTLSAANEAARRNPRYKVPATPTCYPCLLDTLGIPSDFIPLLENGVRRPVNIEYYATVGGTPFDILVEGVEMGQRQAVATSRA